MTVARWVDPNYTTQDAATYKAGLDAAHKVAKRIADAFAPHQVYAGSPNPDLAVEVDAGYIFDGTTLTEVAAQTVSGFATPSAGQQRIDRVVIDQVTGAATRVAGTAVPAGSPSAIPPAITAGTLPCCQVLMTSANASVTDSMITDERISFASQGGEPTGTVKGYVGTTAPTGYVLLSGRTIGSASSGATERANSDTAALYALLWNSMSNTEAPVSTGRGGSAAADFAANKTITLPDARGRVIAGKDNMGGSTANRLTAAASGITGTTLGTSGGSESVTLTTTGLPASGLGYSATSGTISADHTHDVFVNSSVIMQPAVVSDVIRSGGSWGTGGVSANHTHSVSGTTNNMGSGGIHQNTQPTLVLNQIVKL